MTDNEIIAALRLQRVPKIGDVLAKKLIATCGSPSAIFLDKREHLMKIDGIGSWSISDLWDTAYLKAAESEWDFICDQGIQFHYYQDPGYPELLRNCHDGPILLFFEGDIDLDNKRILSVVGTRNMTRFGGDFCERFIEEIAPMDPVIVSGMAFGVDICAQRAATEKGLQTVGCLAHGLNQIYPRQHAQYAQKIRSNGGFMTEFWSTSQPDRENFLRRNRIIAGMSHATLVIESAEKGGSLVTADFAFGYDRDVFAIPGRPSDLFSEGCNTLIKKQKAQMITRAAELIYFMGWDLPETETTGIQRTLFPALHGNEKEIYDYLMSTGRQQIDTIALSCDLPVFKAASLLLNMEMKGVIKPLAGKWFEAI